VANGQGEWIEKLANEWSTSQGLRLAGFGLTNHYPLIPLP
jgi:hypothetical protein